MVKSFGLPTGMTLLMLEARPAFPKSLRTALEIMVLWMERGTGFGGRGLCGVAVRGWEENRGNPSAPADTQSQGDHAFMDLAVTRPRAIFAACGSSRTKQNE